MPLGKVDIVHFLADRYGYRRYLEVATPTTGNYFARVDRDRFTECRRLMYRCPAGFNDGLPIDYRAPDEDVSPALAAIEPSDARFDIILVDGFHTYEVARRDLSVAFALLERVFAANRHVLLNLVSVRELFTSSRL